MWPILQAVWLFLPCYAANMAPVAAARLWPRWTRALDGGRLGRDGRPLLGPNKTWRGLASGAFAGGTTALLLAAAGPNESLDFGRSDGVPGPMVALFGMALGVGALAGDAAKSFLKRRLGRNPGTPWFPFDQLDAVVGGLAAAALAAPLVGGWSLAAYFGDAWVPVWIVVLTPGLHWLSSVLAFAFGLKKRPW